MPEQTEAAKTSLHFLSELKLSFWEPVPSSMPSPSSVQPCSVYFKSGVLEPPLCLEMSSDEPMASWATLSITGSCKIV